MITSYLKTYTLPTATMPVIMDEENTLQAIRSFSANHILELSECISGSVPNISLYEKDPETKHWSVLDARRFIDDISEKPYSGKAMYIIRDFDEATHQAMNALLKILEEPPEYAIIILVAKNPEAIIETIRSRTITFFLGLKMEGISDTWKQAIESYFRNDEVGPLFSQLASEKISQSEGLGILLYAVKFADYDKSEQIELECINIFTVNEPIKNILDRVFL